MPQSLEEYKSYVQRRLNEISELLPSIAMGDLSGRLEVPSEDDEFTELFVSLNYMLDDIQYDIEQRMEIERKLRESEEKYRNLVENSKDSIVIIDLKGNVQYANKTSEELTGYSQEEGIGSNVKDITLKRYWPRSLAALKKARKGKQVPYFESKIKRKDGKILSVETGGQPVIKDGKVEGVQIITRDLTESKRMQDALIESEEKYKNIVETAPDGIATVNLKGTITSVNNTFLELTGFSREEIEGKHFSRLPILRKRDVQRLINIFTSMVGGKMPKPFEVTWTHKNGTENTAEVRISPLKKGKRLTGIQAVARDITERRKAQEALLESEEKFRMFFENEPEYCYMISQEGNILDINQSALKALGYDKNDIIGKPLNMVYSPESQRKMKELFKKWRQTGTLKDEEIEIMSKKGEKHQVLLSAHAVKDKHGNLLNSVSVQRDITERKKAEEALRESQEKLRAIFDNVNDVILHVDPFGEIIEINKQVNEIFGIEREEIIGKNFMDIGSIDEKEMGKLIEMFVTSAEKGDVITSDGEAVNRMELIIKDKKGGDVFVETSTSSLKKDGELVGFSTTLRDITERKQAEEALVQSEARLRRFYDSDLAGFARTRVSDGKLLDVNNYMVELLGYKDRETCLKEYIGEEHWVDPKGRDRMLAQLKETGYARNLELPITKRDGSKIWVSYSAVLYPEDDYIEYVVMDISERKRAEEELRLQSEITVNMSEGVYLIRAEDGIIVYANPKFEKMFGYEPGEIIGKHVSIVNASTEKDPKKTAEEIINVLNKSGAWRGEVKNIKKDGTPFWCYANVSTFDHPEFGRVWVTVHIDITERKRAEEALKESEEKYHSVVENSKDAIIIHQDGIIKFVNTAAWELTGYTKEDLMEKHILDFISPDCHELVLKRYADRVAGKDVPSIYEISIMKKDKSQFPVEINSTIITFEGKTAALVFLRDITERKKAEQAILESEERLRTIFTANPDFTYVTDTDGNILDANPALLKVQNLSLEDIRNRNVLEFFVGEDPEMFLNIADSLKKGREIRGLEVKAKIASGEDRKYEIHAIPLKEGGKVSTILNVARDITERKEAEEKLAYQANLLENVTDAIISTDIDFNIKSWNKAAEKIYGWKENEVLDKEFGKVVITEYPNHDSEQVLSEYKKNGFWEGEVIQKNNDGKDLNIYAKVSMVRDDNENPMGAVATNRDITEKKIAEITLVQSKKLASIGQLAAGVAHELNNPLANISLIAANMSKMTNDPELLKKLTTLSEQGKMATSIVQSLLNFSRKIEPHLKDVSLADTILESITQAKIGKPKNVKITSNIPDIPRIKADSEQLQQAFTNIIDNAFDAMPEGGILSITSKQKDDFVEIHFKDTGLGLSKKDMENIFDPFFTTKEVGKGVGLGLSICHGIIQAHNGKIEVQSDIGKGATFTIKLPVG
jgi:PAS domain S-box-containing protein